MKKLVKLLSIVTMAAAGVLGVANVVKESKKVEEVGASSLMVSGSRVYIEDQTWGNWTKDGVDAIMHVYNVSFVAGSGYSSLNDIKLNDLYATSFATDGSTYMNIRMKWKGGSYRQYEAILPWFIQSYTTEFYATENNTDRYICDKNGGAKISVSVSLGDNKSVYLWGNHDWGGSTYYTQWSSGVTGSYTYEFNGIKSGSHMYISTTDLTGWEDAGAKIGICFGKSNVSNAQIWSSQYNSSHSSMSEAFCWKVQGSANDHLYECIVPQYNGQDVYWSMVIGVRFSSDASSLGWNNVLNQTGDQFYNGDDSDCNMLWVNAATGGSWSGGGYLRSDASISDDTRAEYYGTYFYSQITCSGSGSITSASSNWTNVKNEYKQHLSTDVEGKVWSSSAAETGTDLVKAMYRYDYIVFHKQYSGYDDFINRSTSEGKSYSPRINPLVMNSKKSTTVMIITVISLVSVSAIGGFFFLKKRKETN